MRYSEKFKSNGPLFQKKYSGKEKYFFKINQFVCSGGKIFIHKFTFYLPIFQIQKNFQNKIMPLSRYIEKEKKKASNISYPFLPFFAPFCPLFFDPRILFKFWHLFGPCSATVNNWGVVEPILKTREEGESNSWHVKKILILRFLLWCHLNFVQKLILADLDFVLLIKNDDNLF